MKYIFIILPLIFSFYGESSDDFSRKKDKVLVDSIIFEVGNWRDIGPFRGGRSTASTGITDDDQVYIWVLPGEVYGKRRTQVLAGKIFQMDFLILAQSVW